MALKYIALALLLSACGTTGVVNIAEPEHNTITVEKMVSYECGEAPAIDKVLMLPVIFGDIMTEAGRVFTVAARQYENLGINTANWIKGTAQLRAQRDFYKACIDRSQQLLD